ncbi:MAG: hypothetical protein IT305_31865 [Chloroflexi bacterium]|nr:hypothetical protein [Chloroflexota bacterium]
MTYLTPQTASRFREFDVYWLGPDFDGLPLFAFHHTNVVMGARDILSRYSHRSNIAVVYTRNWENGRPPTSQVSLVLDDAASEYAIPALTSRERFGPTTQEVDVNGHTGFLVPVAGRTRLEVTIGTTWITIFADSSDQALRAARALKKLN